MYSHNDLKPTVCFYFIFPFPCYSSHHISVSYANTMLLNISIREYIFQF